MKKKIVISIIFTIFIVGFYIKPVCADGPLSDKITKGIDRIIEAQEQKEKEEREELERKNVNANLDIGDAIIGATDFLDTGNEMVEEEHLQTFSNSLVNIFIIAGTVIAVIYSAILGTKYMIGSVEEKAEIKETLIPFIIGCVIVFGAFTIWKIAIIIGSGL